MSSSTAISADNGIISITCNNIDFLACMQTTTEECGKAYIDSNKHCSNIFPHISNKEESAIISNAKNYAQCSTSTFISNLGSNAPQFDNCFTFVQPSYDKYIQQLKKAHNNE